MSQNVTRGPCLGNRCRKVDQRVRTRRKRAGTVPGSLLYETDAVWSPAWRKTGFTVSRDGRGLSAPAGCGKTRGRQRAGTEGDGREQCAPCRQAGPGHHDGWGVLKYGLAGLDISVKKAPEVILTSLFRGMDLEPLA